MKLGVLVYLENNDEHVLMIHREKEDEHKGLWLAPGGKVEPNEAPFETAVREMLEETGLKSGFLGSHNMEIQKIKSLLGIPEDIEILGFVTAGVEGDSANLKKDNLNKKKLLHKEKYAK